LMCPPDLTARARRTLTFRRGHGREGGHEAPLAHESDLEQEHLDRVVPVTMRTLQLPTHGESQRERGTDEQEKEEEEGGG